MTFKNQSIDPARGLLHALPPSDQQELWSVCPMTILITGDRKDVQNPRFLIQDRAGAPEGKPPG